VSGLILKRLFNEGSEVKAGDVLYEIDPAPFQAAYNSALATLDASKKSADRARAALAASQANVTRQQAMLDLAKTNADRFEQLLKEKAVSTSERDQAATDLSVATATLKAADAQVDSDRAAIAAADAAIKQSEAAVESSKISLGYTKINAPISGRIGPSAVTEGAIVTAYQPTTLATIQSLDPIYVDVPQSTADLGRLKRNMAAGKITANDVKAVKIVLEDGTQYAKEGTLKFRDVSVDLSTGSVILRIQVPNPDSVLLPGMFVRAIIEEGVNAQGILIPQESVSRDPKGTAIALVLDADGKVQPRAITADRAIGDKWLVSSGLTKGDRVIVEGLQKVRPGMPAKVAAPKQPATQPVAAAPAK
jgi:membrane fusion protein (multidrug efflux system)